MQAVTRHSFAVGPGPLGAVLRSIAGQGGSEIGYPEPLVRGHWSPGASGTLTTREALTRALRGSRLRLRSVGTGSFLIEADRAPPVAAPSATASGAPAADIAEPIVVTGSKRATPEMRFPGAVQIVATGFDESVSRLHNDGDLVARLPLLQSTAFGPGRDKLFVRGVADSSFAGPTQATVGLYFGDTRLLYSGPDPALRLVDTRQVEILEGPQGTLYGAGAIGGIIRIVPKSPDMSRVASMAEGALAATQDGRPGYDADGMINLPIVTDRAALRLVGYHAYDGGYIDNPARGLRAVNATSTDGGRAALRLRPADAWTIDLTGLGQHIASADPQYAVRADGPLSQPALLRQPYRDTTMLGSLGIRRESADELNVLLNIGGVKRTTHQRYDATPPSATDAIAYDERAASNLIDGEARIWRTTPSGSGWLLGVAGVENHTAARRQLGHPDTPRDISGVDNRTLDLALFGEGTASLAPGLLLTLGGRLTHARVDGEPLDVPLRPLFKKGPSTFIRGEGHTRFDPSASFSAWIARGLSFYGRYARGFRAGGLAIAAGVGRVAAYRPDSIMTLESGLRAQGLWGGKLSGSIGLSQSWWQNIQADLVTRNGFPFTANIGNGRLLALETRIAARPVPRLGIDLQSLFTQSRIVDPAPGFEREGGNDLPDTPRIGYSGTISWFPPLDRTERFGVELAVRHQGASRFGAGALLGIDQKGYTNGDISMRVRRGHFDLAASVENVTNAKGDRFAVGNPFQLRVINQSTPLRPRTLRLTVTVLK